MTPNNNFSVLPFYRSIEEQHHRKSYAYGQVYPLFCPTNMLIPFQIQRKHSTRQLTSANLYRKDGSLVGDILAYLTQLGLKTFTFETLDLDVIVFPANLPFQANMEEGQHYLVITDGQETWYSDIFTAVSDMSGYLTIEWSNKSNLVSDSGIIVYEDTPFKNKLYLCTELGKPDYTFSEEGENRDGYFFAEKQVSEKTYKCTILATEYLCDVMRLIRMADYIVVTDRYGREYKCDTFLMTPKWQTQGDLASVEIEFQTDTIVKKIGRTYAYQEPRDFNEDFNNDFDIWASTNN